MFLKFTKSIQYTFTEGANGDGMAVVSSLRSFDREQQKEYLIPIVIKDSGNPAMSGTSTLTVVIGDVNDNKMQPGSKDIFVYNYMVCVLVSFINKSFGVFLIFVDDCVLFVNCGSLSYQKIPEMSKKQVLLPVKSCRNFKGHLS